MTVTKANHVFLDKAPVTLENLALALKPILQGDPGVLVNADSGAPEGTVVEAML
jgi:biopolymer transport protein ExbD